MCAVVPVALGLLAVFAQGADGPVLFSDELAYLGMAVSFSDPDAAVHLSELEFYSPGYGLLLAPFVGLVGLSPWTVAVVANLVLLAALGPLLRLLLLEVLEIRPQTATLAATVAACTPSIVLQVSRAWPEVLLATMLALWALLLARFVKRRAPVTGLLALAVALGTFTVHRRSLVVVAVTVALVAAMHGAALRREGDERQRAGAWLVGTLAVTAVYFVLNRALDQHVRDRLYQDADLVNANERAAELVGEGVLPRVVSQGWANVHGTFGLVLLGLLGLVLLGWRTRVRPFAVALAVVTGGALVVSAVAVADGPRVDHALYERYLAPVTVLSVAIGLAVYLDSRARIPRWSMLALPATTFVMLLAVPDGQLTGNVQKLTVPTLAAIEHLHRASSMPFLPGISPLRVSAVVSAVALVVLVIRRHHRDAGAFAVFVVFSVVVLAGSIMSLRPFLDHWERFGVVLADGISAEGDDAGPVGVSSDAPDPVRAVVQYRLGHRPIASVDDADCPPVDHVIAGPDFRPQWGSEQILVSDLPPAVLYRTRC